MSWTFKIGLIISVIVVVLSVVVVMYDVSNNNSGKITPTQITTLKWTFGYAVLIVLCFVLYHYNFRALGSTLLWIANVPAIIVALFGLAIIAWGPMDFK